MALDPSALANLARCLDCVIPPGAQLSVTNYLLAQWALAVNPRLDVTPSALANAARCYDSCIPPGMQPALTNYLLYEIAAGGGGGGGSINPIYTGVAPPAAPAFPLQGALFVPDNDALPFQVWIPGTGWTVR